ncbi:MAG: hypothetical protein COU81_02585 [Candidatus Portnoybacteria bacterium CG10_big_fil_rev_8_21_14_0_10_36_7]|uniref:Peptidase S24/S26A/S26B/S26C domain-containing protein n=1 Tax=Candidatus Portnoybacteria bacterium CG10_big_fil_rev_8_21_14_0_10_36_7 TaxID=1974812 RepID=A0A2M8KDU4_9BACT|nr:MAG: hypothetical protein COU81_02585 [Candidatus Portnoybacteria bacterium CG10_big_fil_rev_8_21_14_0_10_36_7]
MHIIQEKLIQLLEKKDVSGMTLREIGKKIGEPDSPQKIKHHLNQLAKRGLIRFDKKNKEIKKIESGKVEGTNLISIPILGSANCGEAVIFADEQKEGYLKVSSSLLGNIPINRAKDLFALRALGESMNRANIEGNTIDDGDYVIIDKSKINPSNNEYVLSVIDGLANIKKIFKDEKNQQVVLYSESSQNYPPIYIHEDDFDRYLINGTVVRVMKQPDELSQIRDASARDILKDLGPQSKKEYEYYKNL